MDNNYLYKKVDVFTFNRKTFCKFMSDNGKIAFLIMDKDGKYYYPSIEDLVAIIKHDGIDLNTLCALRDDDNKYYHFIPKVWIKNTACAITMAVLLSACGPSLEKAEEYQNDYTSYVTENPEYNYSSSNTTKPTPTPSITAKPEEDKRPMEITTIDVDPNSSEYTFDDPPKGTNDSIVYDSQDYSTIISRLKDGGEPQIYKYPEDVYISNKKDSVQLTDSINYRLVFGYDRPSQQALYKIIDGNNNIPDYYKDLIKSFISNTFNVAPDTDFTVLAENLKKLKVIEKTGYELAKATISDCALACFVQKEDTIYTDSAATKDEVFMAIFFHELGHAARLLSITTSDYKFVKVSFSPLGQNNNIYVEEALDTISTSRDNVGKLYPLFVNYINIAIENTGYNASDYFNHSINLFGGKVEKLHGDIIRGSDLIILIENAGTYVYGPRGKTNESDLQTLNSVMIKIYLSNHPESSFEEVYEAINKNLENQRDRYESIVGKDVLLPIYESVVNQKTK